MSDDQLTQQVREWWSGYRCDYGTSTNMFGRTPVYAQETEWVRALEQAHFAAGYYPTQGGYIGSRRNCPRGIGGRDCQENGSNCSLHNYGLAWDIEYNYNRMYSRVIDEVELQQMFDAGMTKYNPAIVASILSVKTTGGRHAFAWRGYILGDLMHWQYNAPPDDRQIDWTTVGNTDGEGMLRLGEEGPNVQKWQAYCNRWAAKDYTTWNPIAEDGVFGTITEQITKDFQRWASIEDTGMVGYMDMGSMAIVVKPDRGEE